MAAVACGGASVAASEFDAAIGRAAEFLERQQSPDGAWRSETYGVFKDDPALTPTIVSALHFAAPGHASCRRGIEYLARIAGRQKLKFPVYTAAAAAWAVVLEETTEETRRAQAAWLRELRRHQLTGALGWRPEDPEFGGWGYSMEPPRRPEYSPRPCEANLSATLFALGALGADADALTFVMRCQNEDGGFCFSPTESAANKSAALDDGRFASYGSMTADGLRALLRCGLPVEHPRVTAAADWLKRNFSATQNPGRFAADRPTFHAGSYYYYAWSVAHAFRALELRGAVVPEHWRSALAAELLRRQRADGSWANEFKDVREDDPLVATPLALSALILCR